MDPRQQHASCGQNVKEICRPERGRAACSAGKGVWAPWKSRAPSAAECGPQPPYCPLLAATSCVQRIALHPQNKPKMTHPNTDPRDYSAFTGPASPRELLLEHFEQLQRLRVLRIQRQGLFDVAVCILQQRRVTIAHTSQSRDAPGSALICWRAAPGCSLARSCAGRTPASSGGNLHHGIQRHQQQNRKPQPCLTCAATNKSLASPFLSRFNSSTPRLLSDSCRHSYMSRVTRDA